MNGREMVPPSEIFEYENTSPQLSKQVSSVSCGVLWSVCGLGGVHRVSAEAAGDSS